MILPAHPDLHITYCSNIHPGEDWKSHASQIKKHLPTLKARLSPDTDFGVGLRLSALAAQELAEEEPLNEFREWLEQHGCYLFTINGFPYGTFHGDRVKDNVYAPDWTTLDRLTYTKRLSDILAFLLPDGIEGGISTSPISYKFWEKAADGHDDILSVATVNLARVAFYLHQIFESTGKVIHLDIEPEPDCTLEDSDETVAFFTKWLFPKGSDFLKSSEGLTRVDAENILRRHIRICYDTCHFALQYEEPEKAIKVLSENGISIGKTQVSSALKIDWTSGNAENSVRDIIERLKGFDEPVYLHQVIEKQRNGAFKRYRDLPQAIDRLDADTAAEWRIHFHVPLFLDQFGELTSTRDHITRALPILMDEGDCKHYEIETYTWDVLPEMYKTGLTESIEREFQWLLKQMEKEC